MYTTDLQIIGERLATFREYIGLTQAQVAEAVHLAEKNYSLIENGKSEMKLLTFITICNALMISADDVLQDDSQKTECLAEIHELLETCSQPDLKAISRLIHYYLRFRK